MGLVMQRYYPGSVCMNNDNAMIFYSNGSGVERERNNCGMYPSMSISMLIKSLLYYIAMQVPKMEC
jgi:hypothetical protein